MRGARKSKNPRDQQFIRAAQPVAQNGTLQNKILTTKFSYNVLQRYLAPSFFLSFLILHFPFFSLCNFIVFFILVHFSLPVSGISPPPFSLSLSLSFLLFFNDFFSLSCRCCLSSSSFLSLFLPFQLPSPPYQVHLSLVEQEIAFFVPSSRQQVASGFRNDDVASRVLITRKEKKASNSRCVSILARKFFSFFSPSNIVI
jgi:hypothetical protein